MKFYGLQWIADDDTPMQIRIETRTLETWARSCPRGGEWTAWRRLDVYRNADGTLNETCMNAIHAQIAGAAKKLEASCVIKLAGAVEGSGVFDGQHDVHIKTSLGKDTTTATDSKLAELEQRIASLEGKDDGSAQIGDLMKRVSDLEQKVRTLDEFVLGHFNQGS